jgi:hypothetical protein
MQFSLRLSVSHYIPPCLFHPSLSPSLPPSDLPLPFPLYLSPLSFFPSVLLSPPPCSLPFSVSQQSLALPFSPVSLPSFLSPSLTLSLFLPLPFNSQGALPFSLPLPLPFPLLFLSSPSLLLILFLSPSPEAAEKYLIQSTTYPEFPGSLHLPTPSATINASQNQPHLKSFPPTPAPGPESPAAALRTAIPSLLVNENSSSALFRERRFLWSCLLRQRCAVAPSVRLIHRIEEILFLHRSSSSCFVLPLTWQLAGPAGTMTTRLTPTLHARHLQRYLPQRRRRGPDRQQQLQLIWVGHGYNVAYDAQAPGNGP